MKKAPTDAVEPGGPRVETKSESNVADLAAGIIEACRLGGGGFSADRVVADDELNAAFAGECRRLGLAGTETDWNHALFRLRKAGS
jgi:hypothetical protein